MAWFRWIVTSAASAWQMAKAAWPTVRAWIHRGIEFVDFLFGHTAQTA